MTHADLYEGSGEYKSTYSNVPPTLYPLRKLFQPIKSYYDKGNIIATDNWYTSKEALEFIRDTLRNDFVGTCKANKKGIPNDGLFPKDGRGKQRIGACKQMVITKNGRNFNWALVKK